MAPPITDALRAKLKAREEDGVAFSDRAGRTLADMMPIMTDREKWILEEVGYQPELEAEAEEIVERRRAALFAAKSLLHQRYLARMAKKVHVFELEEDDFYDDE